MPISNKEKESEEWRTKIRTWLQYCLAGNYTDGEWEVIENNVKSLQDELLTALATRLENEEIPLKQGFNGGLTNYQKGLNAGLSLAQSLIKELIK